VCRARADDRRRPAPTMTSWWSRTVIPTTSTSIARRWTAVRTRSAPPPLIVTREELGFEAVHASPMGPSSATGSSSSRPGRSSVDSRDGLRLPRSTGTFWNQVDTPLGARTIAVCGSVLGRRPAVRHVCEPELRVLREPDDPVPDRDAPAEPRSGQRIGPQTVVPASAAPVLRAARMAERVSLPDLAGTIRR